MRSDLLAWQWSLYAEGHRSRGNLLVHAVSQPLFIAGCLEVLATPLVGVGGLLGLVSMAVALALQGRGHKGEATSPVPFDGPLDFVRRFFAEQWVTFPRFVLSGRFARAWREADPTPSAGS